MGGSSTEDLGRRSRSVSEADSYSRTMVSHSFIALAKQHFAILHVSEEKLE